MRVYSFFLKEFNKQDILPPFPSPQSLLVLRICPLTPSHIHTSPLSLLQKYIYILYISLFPLHSYLYLTISLIRIGKESCVGRLK